MSVQGGEGKPRRDMSTATALCGAIIKQRSQAPTGAARSCRKEFPQEFPRLGCRQLPRALLCPGDSEEPSQHLCWAAMGVLCQDHDASLTQHHLCSGGRTSPAGLLGQGEALGIAPQVKSGEIKGKTLKLCQGRFTMDIRKDFITGRVVKQEEASQGSVALGTWFKWWTWQCWVGLSISGDFSNLNYSVILNMIRGDRGAQCGSEHPDLL